MGYVREYGSTGVFWISKREEVQVLIDIFSNHPLNTTKHLNFVAWAKGFNLLQKYKLSRDKNLLDDIANLKADMNKRRTHFILPSDHTISITPQWFMGFFEGEGSVFVSRKDYTLSISIGQALIDENAMLKVGEFLNQLSDANLFKPYGENVVKIYRTFETNEHPRGKIELVISQTDFIKFVLIPFFDSQQWYSKKYLDFIDFKTILSLKEKGHHYSKEGKDLINLILSQMNNKRLSTFNQPIIEKDAWNIRIKELFNKPNFEIREGRIWIISENRFQSEGGKSKSLELWDDKGNLVKSFKSIAECGRYLSKSPTTISRFIKKGDFFTHHNQNLIIKYNNY